jgi:hypothetical protein
MTASAAEDLDTLRNVTEQGTSHLVEDSHGVTDQGLADLIRAELASATDLKILRSLDGGYTDARVPVRHPVSHDR